MITLYSGEMFISPIPLHLSLNYCSHKCAYCFANLNNPGRTAEIKKLQSQLKNFWGQNNLIAKLMREKYPVMISNTVDPFATSNYQLTPPIVDQLTDLGIPVTFQTRGASNAKAAEALDYVIKNTPKSLWYVSITTTSEDLRKQLEPGAPSIESRFDLIDKLKAAGHNVVVGINPYVPEWIPDIEDLTARLYSKGIRNIWLGILHFNQNQKLQLSEKERAAIGDKLVNKPMKEYNAEHDTVEAVRQSLAAKFPGLNVFMGLNGKENHFFDIYHETYPGKTFPVYSDFYNHIAKSKQAGDQITFNDLMHVFASKLPTGNYDFSGAAYSMKRADYDKPEVRELINSLKDCHISKYVNVFWNDKVFNFQPNIHEGFASLVELVGDEYQLKRDEKGNEIFIYDSVNNHFGEMYVEQ